MNAPLASLQIFTSCLEKQDLDTTYDWRYTTKYGGCLGIRYADAMGLEPDGYVQVAVVKVRGGQLDDVVLNPKPWTYIAALERARRALPSTRFERFISYLKAA